MGGGSRFPGWRTTLAIGILALLFASGLSGLGAAPHNASLPSGPSPGSTAPGAFHPAPYRSMLVSAGVVNRTLVLFNNSVRSGDFLAGSGGSSEGFAYDPTDQLLYFSTTQGESLMAVNPTTDAITTFPALPVVPQTVGYDPGTGELYVAGSSGDVCVVNPTTGLVTATITTAAGGGDFAFDPTKDLAFLPSFDSDTLIVLNTTSNTLTTTVPINSGPGYAVYSAATRDFYVTAASDEVAVYSTASGRVVTNMTVGNTPEQLGLDPVNGDLYVPDVNSAMVTVVNITLQKTVANVSVGTDPWQVLYDSSSNDLYSLNEYTDNITVISGLSNTKITTIALNGSTDAFFLEVGDPTNGDIYVPSETVADASVVQASTNSLICQLPLGSSPTSVAIDTLAQRIYITDAARNNVTIVNGGTFKEDGGFPTGTGPSSIAIDARDHKVFVVNSGSDNVTVANATSGALITSVPVGTDPVALVYDAGLDVVFVANEGTSNVMGISGVTDGVVSTFGGESSPVALTLDNATGDLYVVNDVGSVLVVSASSGSVVGRFSAGGFAATITYVPTNGDIYVGNWWAANLTVYSGTTNKVVDSSIPLGISPRSVVFDPDNLMLYAAEVGNASVEALNTTTNTVVGTATDGLGPNGMAFDGVSQGVLTVDETLGTLDDLVVPTSPDPVISSFVITPSSVALGASVNLRVNAGGGTGSLSDAYAGLPAGCTTHNSPSFSCSPSVSGSFLVRAYANDTAGHSSTATASLTVVSGGGGATLTGVSVSPTSATVGVSSTTGAFTATPTCSTTCPATGLSYSWTASHPSWGTLNTPTAASTTFTSGSTPGTLDLYVNVTLNGTTVQSLPAKITISTGTSVEYTVHFYVSPARCGDINFSGFFFGNDTSANFFSASSDAITAPACAGDTFHQWNATGGVSVTASSSDPTTATTSANGTLTAWYLANGTGGKTPSYTVTFLDGPAGCPADFNGTSQTNNTVATFLAGNYTASAPVCTEYSFTEFRWGHDKVVLVSTTTPALLDLTANSTLTTVYTAAGSIPSYTVTFDINRAACGPLTFNGTSQANQSSVQVLAGTYSVSAPACTGETFRDFAWAFGPASGSTTSNPTTVDVMANGTITATYLPTSALFAVSLSISPSTCGPIQFNGSSESNGAILEVTAGTYTVRPVYCPRYQFSDWTWSPPEAEGTFNMTGWANITITSNGTLDADFLPNIFYEVTFTSAPATCPGFLLSGESWWNASIIVESGATISVRDGDSRTIEALDCPGHPFIEWSGTGGAGVGPTFLENGTDLSVFGNGTVTADYGEVVPLVAWANATVTGTTGGCGEAGTPWSVTVDFNGTVRGGDPPYSHYVWDLGDDAYGVFTEPNITWTFYTVDYEWTVYLNATDSLGYQVGANTTVHVPIANCPVPHTPSPGFSILGLSTTTSYLLIALLAVAVVAILAAVVLLRRKKDPPPSAPPTLPAPTHGPAPKEPDLGSPPNR